jgi:hypothetical protein
MSGSTSSSGTTRFSPYGVSQRSIQSRLELRSVATSKRTTASPYVPDASTIRFGVRYVTPYVLEFVAVII